MSRPVRCPNCDHVEFECLECGEAMSHHIKKAIAAAVQNEREAWRPHAFSDNRKCIRCRTVALPNRHPFTVCDDCWDESHDVNGQGEHK